MTTEPQQPTVLDAAAIEPGFGEVVLKDGPGGLRAKRFVGRFLTESKDYAKAGIEVTKVYRSRKGKFVVQHQVAEWAEFPQRSDLISELKADWRSWRNVFGVGTDEPEWGDYTVEIVDTVDELRDKVSPKLYRRVAAAVETPSTEDLDI
ncbi:EXLDI protein [Nocardia pseudobrasiliensis]|uniref:EXLDI family protein n=1 Tax=Nocardia pseudobrasiliensis TaxID=45979 RepID=A0A370I1G5_9NOCA|nr:EXLDI protein [Nocardia pseudobrasiliensis]RDI64579.1 EXLDI family protein [Nocardia pseudobrasiliensis]